MDQIKILETTARETAAKLLDIGAIKLNHQKPFTWSSGWKSPIYCDNRLALSYPPIRSYIKLSLAKAIKDYFPLAECIAGVATAGIPQGALVAEELQLPFVYVRAKAIKDYFPLAECIAGVATAGIPQGALVAEELQLPFVYVRPKPKEHGMGNLIEGKIEKGQKVVLVEDLISTGGSSLKAAQAMREAGFDVIGMVAIFTYGFEQSEKSFSEEKIKLICLSDFNHLLQEALERKYLDENQLIYVKSWKLDPANWK